MQYDLHELLGRGSFGSVYRATSRANNKVYAVKIINVGYSTTSHARMCVLNEVRILATHVCPFIVSFKEVFVRNQDLCIATEYAENGDLQNLIKTQEKKNTHFSENTVWYIFLQTAIALDYLHKLNVMHRDVKPANILIDANDTIKLADVGIAKLMRNIGYGQTVIGTPLYMSPEVLKRERYGIKTDAWSLGCVLYEIMCLRPAFQSTSMFALRNDIILARIHPISRDIYSTYLISIVYKLIKASTRLRWCISTLLIQPEVSKMMKEREMQRSECNPRVKPLFYKALSPPLHMEDWKRLSEMFCELNHTIQLSDSMAVEMKLVSNLRNQLDRANRAVTPRSMNVRVVRPARIQINNAFVNKKRAEIAEHERKIIVLRKEILDNEKAILRLRKLLGEVK